MYDYRGLSLKKLNTPAYSHLLLLLFWPLFGLGFFLVEQVIPLPFHEIVCSWDALVPFCEYFVIPYYLWFLFLPGMLLYLLLMDVPNFRRYMWFIIISYSIAMLTYLLYPSCQLLRVETFPRENVLTAVVAGLYQFDTNTNVCPSIHVIGMCAAAIAGWKTPRMQHWGWKLFWLLSAVMVSLSTVFIKQHSVIDLVAALAVVGGTYWLVYCTGLIPAEEKAKQEAAALWKSRLTVPNFLSALRILLLPPIFVLYQRQETRLWAFALLALSCLSDAFDGYFARKYGLVSDFGKALDAIADKLMQLALLLCLLQNYWQALILCAALFLKELLSGVLGLLYLKRTGRVKGALWFGKVATFLLDVCLLAMFFFDRLPTTLVWVMVWLCLAAMLLASAGYLLRYRQLFRELPEKHES